MQKPKLDLPFKTEIYLENTANGKHYTLGFDMFYDKDMVVTMESFSTRTQDYKQVTFVLNPQQVIELAEFFQNQLENTKVL